MLLGISNALAVRGDLSLHWIVNGEKPSPCFNIRLYLLLPFGKSSALTQGESIPAVNLPVCAHDFKYDLSLLRSTPLLISTFLMLVVVVSISRG